MKSNLRRVLAVVLMLTVMAVNFTIPAMAADITVNYTDLPMDILGHANANLQQGILFFETGTLGSTAGSGLDNTTNYNRSFAPLEVWSNATNASLNMKPSEWVKYDVSAAEAGYYSVGIVFGTNAQAGVDMIIRTDSTILETHLSRLNTNQYNWQTIDNLGYVYLNVGSNSIYVENKSAAAAQQINFKSLTFTKDNTADATMVKMLKPVESANEFSGFADGFYADGYNTITTDGTPLTFPVSVTEDGKYKVSVRGKASGANAVSADFGGITKDATVSNTAYADAELGVFPLAAGDYTLTLSGLNGYELAWVTMEYVAPYATQIVSESIADGATVSRGTDSYVIEFNDMMDSVDASQVTLEASGATIPVAVDVTDEIVTVSFLETLDFETGYTLTLSGLKGTFDVDIMADKVVNFTTDNDTNTTGTATLEVTDISSYRDDGTVTGIVKGSTGVGIKGRTVTVLNSTSGVAASGLSGDNGVFTLNFTITEPVAGVYTYTVNSEYGATAPATITYVSQDEEIRILGLFAGATTASDVAAIFGPSADILGAPNYATDIASLSNTDLFHNHFIGKAFSRVEDLAPYYNKMLLLEQMNQATTGSYVYANFINQYLVCKQLGFDMDQWALLNSTDLKNAVATAFVGTSVATTEQAFYDRYNDAVEKVLLKEAGALDSSYTYANTLDITGHTTSLYYGGEISIPLKFTVAQTKVSKINVTVDATDPMILANAQAVVRDASGTAVSVSGNTATFNIVYNFDAGKSYSDIGRLALQGSVLGSHTFTVNGLVTYYIEKTVDKLDADGNPIIENSQRVQEIKSTEISLPVPVAPLPNSFSVTVSSNPTNDNRDFGTGGGGYVAPPKEVKPEDEEQTNKSDYFFDDMSDALWAQDMVHTLVGKGVISKNSERAYRPMDNITREEYLKMIITVIGSHDPNAVSDLSDVGAGHWATSYIATAQKLGIVQGNADGSFGIGTNITRQDMAVMIYRTFAMLGIDLSAGDAAFADSNEISEYAKDAVSALTKLGILNGMGDNTFAPGANANRAQAAKVIYVMMEVLGV